MGICWNTARKYNGYTHSVFEGVFVCNITTLTAIARAARRRLVLPSNSIGLLTQTTDYTGVSWALKRSLILHAHFQYLHSVI